MKSNLGYMYEGRPSVDADSLCSAGSEWFDLFRRQLK